MIRRETIRLDNLTIGYRRKQHAKVVAEGLCASVRSGELTCLLGQNGVGKSTLLRTLSAFRPPLEGSVLLMDRPLERYSVGELSRTLSVVLTDKCDLTNMSVRELVGMGRSPYTGFWGRLSAEDTRLIDEALRLVGIMHLSDRMVQTLSDGERQKVMIAKALAQQTPVILLDEPTAFLDFPSKVEIMQLLHRLTRETGRTIFLSTHDLELALQISDRIWLMKKGEGIHTGTPEDLSLDGTMAGFFPHRGIVFDPATGLFRIENRYRYRVRLTGDGIPRAMTDKALRRSGIDPDGTDSDACRIEAGRTFRLRRGDRTIECQTIGALLEHLEADDSEADDIEQSACPGHARSGGEKNRR